MSQATTHTGYTQISIQQYITSSIASRIRSLPRFAALKDAQAAPESAEAGSYEHTPHEQVLFVDSLHDQQKLFNKEWWFHLDA